ncbi:MAG: hypothetical protein Q9187_008671 [Circinaria calcarea]
MSASKLNIIRDSFSLTTWLLAGACLQSLLALLLPTRVALLPAVILVTVRLINGALITRGYIRNPYLDGTFRGRSMVPMPGETELASEKSSNKEMVVFIVGASSNHPLGIFAPGFKELGDLFQNMWIDAEADRAKSGYLGKTSTLMAIEHGAGTTILTISYWQSMAHLQAFANSPVHRLGLNWWTKNHKEYPHIGIMHETYVVPWGNWENIYDNFHPIGMGQTVPFAQQSEKGGNGPASTTSPLVEVKGAKWKSLAGRMGRLTAVQG